MNTEKIRGIVNYRAAKSILEKLYQQGILTGEQMKKIEILNAKSFGVSLVGKYHK